jgi:hypothetical protein
MLEKRINEQSVDYTKIKHSHLNALPEGELWAQKTFDSETDFVQAHDCLVERARQVSPTATVRNPLLSRW